VGPRSGERRDIVSGDIVPQGRLRFM